jgi:hypothetical protein
MADFYLPSEVDGSAASEVGAESLGDLLLDCHTFLTLLLARQQSKWVERDGQRLLCRLGALVEWQTLH